MEPAVKQPRPLTIGRLAIGVCLGILLASVITGFVFYLAIERPRQAEALRLAQVQADLSLREMEADNQRMEAQKVEIEQEIQARRHVPQQVSSMEDDVPVRSASTPLKYAECAARDSSVSTRECETRLAPDAPVVMACASFDRNSHEYRACVVPLLATPRTDAWKQN